MSDTKPYIILRTGLPVKGYVAQSQAKIDLANEVKIMEERCLRQIDKLMDASKDPEQVDLDGRMLALAKTGIQQSFMWLVRSIFQPERIALPEDEETAGLDDFGG